LMTLTCSTFKCPHHCTGQLSPVAALVIDAWIPDRNFGFRVPHGTCWTWPSLSTRTWHPQVRNCATEYSNEIIHFVCWTENRIL